MRNGVVFAVNDPYARAPVASQKQSCAVVGLAGKCT